MVSPRGSAKIILPWREVLDYYKKATQLDLLQTPKETKDISTQSYCLVVQRQ